MISAQALGELLALGLEGQTLLAVVTIFERDADRATGTSPDVTRASPGDVTRASPGVTEASPEFDELTAGARRQRKYKEKLASRQASPGVTEGVTSDVTSVTTLSPSASPPAPPSPPSLINPSPLTPPPPPPPPPTKIARARENATRLPEGWEPEARNFSFAVRELGSLLRVEQELSKFRDYWVARPGEGGRKLDWDATWRNWIRSSKERGSRGPPPERTPTFIELEDEIQQRHSHAHGYGSSDSTDLLSGFADPPRQSRG